MQIQFQTESPNNKIHLSNQIQQTKCAKMTEEAEKIRNGINGAAANIHGFTTTTIITTSSNSSSYSSNRGQQIEERHHKTSSELDGAVLISPSNTTIASSNSSKVGNNNGPITATAAAATTAIGGRLQFFKDGKFILELARSREGEKTGWVSVPRKTYWPPAASLITNTTNHQKNESSTSLSFSDDNSSIQSSPWQRDHCWKQSSPRRNISEEMTMYYHRPVGYIFTEKFHKTAKKKRRRPYDIQTEIPPVSQQQHKSNGINQLETERVNFAKNSSAEIKIETETDEIITVKKEIIDENDAEEEDETEEEHSSEQSNMKWMIKCNSDNIFKRRNCNRKILKRQKLSTILQKLIDRIPEGMVLLSVSGTHGAINHLTSNNSRIDLLHHQQHVSPRKRILRELEKVSLDDLTTMKRSRAKGTNHSVAVSPQLSSSTVTSTISQVIPIGSASQQISFPYGSGSTKTMNGNHCESIPLSTPITQPTSRPISSYSITSLLGHNSNNNNNNNNINIKMEQGSTSSSQKDSIVDPAHLRTMLTSPKSPAASSSTHQTAQKPSSAFSSKKSSSSCLSPQMPTTPSNFLNHYSRNSSLHSPINYGRNRSPDLSPSPEQIYTRYRQSHGISSSASSPSSTGFHPYLSSAASSSRGSPSGALSPPSNDTLRYRSNLLPPSSPSHPTYSTAATSAGSPLSYARYSPSAYSQISPQHFSTKTTHTSPAFNLNNLINSSTGKGRDLSPNTLKPETIRDTYIGTRTVPKKTAALRQQYEASVSSPSADSKTTDLYYKSTAPIATNEQITHRKSVDGIGSNTLNLSRSRSPPDTSIKYEKDYHRTINVSNANPPLLAGLDIESNSSIIRPSLVPSMQHPQNMYYMYSPHASSVGVATSSPFLPPVYYHSMALAASAYRNPLWMHFPTAVPQSRMPTAQMLAYGGGLGPPVPPTTTPPWGTVPHHSLLADDPVSLVRIKDEPSSDVPLNLSKH